MITVMFDPQKDFRNNFSGAHFLITKISKVVKLVPGANQLIEEDYELLKEQETFKALVEKGEIAEVEAPAETAEAVPKTETLKTSTKTTRVKRS